MEIDFKLIDKLIDVIKNAYNESKEIKNKILNTKN